MNNIRLNYNENKYTEKMFRGVPYKIHEYPSSDFANFKDVLAEYIGVSPDMIYFGNGIDELILSVVLLFSKEQQSIIIPENTYNGYINAAGIANREVLLNGLTNNRISVDNIMKSVKSNTRIIFICNPHNPTGSLLSIDEVRKLANFAVSRKILLVIDEAYIEYVCDDLKFKDYMSSDYVMRLRTFSKFYGAAGLRCGYAISSRNNISKIYNIKNSIPFNVNKIAQDNIPGVFSIVNKHFTEIFEHNERIKYKLYDFLNQHKIRYLNSYANFVFINFEYDCLELTLKLNSNYGISVKYYDSDELCNYIRVSLTVEEEIDYFTSCLKKLLILRKGNAFDE